jgi:hypothetical protein
MISMWSIHLLLRRLIEVFTEAIPLYRLVNSPYDNIYNLLIDLLTPPCASKSFTTVYKTPGCYTFTTAGVSDGTCLSLPPSASTIFTRLTPVSARPLRLANHGLSGKVIVEPQGSSNNIIQRAHTRAALANRCSRWYAKVN